LLGIIALGFSAFYFFFAKVAVARKLVRSESIEEIIESPLKKLGEDSKENLINPEKISSDQKSNT
jgi:hypothetical protein